MRPPLLRLHTDDLIVDNFAGGGGASLGIEWALGRSPDIAVNHDPEAVAMHAANHPSTHHLCGDVWDVHPRKVCQGRRVALAWFSPDCTTHSKAKGGKPIREAGKKSRALAWVVTRWARSVKPRVIILENVEEFEDWGPLDENDRPDPLRRGLTFRRWKGELEGAGYVVELRQLRSSDYGAPTSRKRLFIIARCDGQPIVWPAPTHGPGRDPFRTAAECIDWSIPCPSIFGRKKPLADKTMARIARGVWRYVLGSAEPFIVPTTHGGYDAAGGARRDHRVHSLREPMRTITGQRRGDFALIAPSLIQTGYGERKGQAPRCLDIHKPLGTIIAGGTGGNGKHALCTAFLAKHYGGHETPGAPLSAPVSTITTKDHHHLVSAFVVKHYGTSTGSQMTLPLPTITANGKGGGHLAEVRAFLIQYNGTSAAQPMRAPLNTVTTHDRFGLVTIAGQDFQIVDIGMRMLSPRELYRAQSFGDEYRIDDFLFAKTSKKTGKKGTPKPLSKTAQIRCCGNSVTPILAAALIAAQFAREAEVAA